MGQVHKIDCIVRPLSLSFGDFFHTKYPSEILLRFLLLNGQFAHNYFHLPDTCWGKQTTLIRVLQVSNWLYPITLSFRRMLLPNCFKTILQRAHFIIMARASYSLLLNHSCHVPWIIKTCSDKWVNWNAVLFCRIDISKTTSCPIKFTRNQNINVNYQTSQNMILFFSVFVILRSLSKTFHRIVIWFQKRICDISFSLPWTI